MTGGHRIVCRYCDYSTWWFGDDDAWDAGQVFRRHVESRHPEKDIRSDDINASIDHGEWEMLTETQEGRDEYVMYGLSVPDSHKRIWNNDRGTTRPLDKDSPSAAGGCVLVLLALVTIPAAVLSAVVLAAHMG